MPSQQAKKRHLFALHPSPTPSAASEVTRCDLPVCPLCFGTGRDQAFNSAFKPPDEYRRAQAALNRPRGHGQGAPRGGDPLRAGREGRALTLQRVRRVPQGDSKFLQPCLARVGVDGARARLRDRGDALYELGASKPADRVRDTIRQISGTRYNGRKLTFFTTNHPDARHQPAEVKLEERAGARLTSRLYEMCETVTVGARITGAGSPRWFEGRHDYQISGSEIGIERFVAR